MRRRISLYAAVFILGFVIMGFEMVASRIMVPSFGSGIDTWAALISTMLIALTTGYFTGGALPGRFKTARVVGTIVIAASFYLAVVPLINADLFHFLSDHLGDGVAALLAASMLLCFIPVTLLGMFTPCSVDLMAAMSTEQHAGSIAGRLYGISTLGSVCGTLSTAFLLIPHIGSANLTLVLACLAFLTALLLWTLA
jgi:predicted membrane-bound spermidine synthase